MMDLQLHAGDSVNLKSDKLGEKNVSLSSRSVVYTSFLWSIALGLALVLSGMVAIVQAQTRAQGQLGVASNDSRAGKEDEKVGIGLNERAKEGKEYSELLEEMRQMRQSIERLEARISQLEAEKSGSATRLVLATSETVPSQPQKPAPSPDDRGARFLARYHSQHDGRRILWL